MREKLLQFVVQTVREKYATHHKPTNGALLAEQVGAKFNGSPYAEAGFEKLSDVIREASTRGDLVRNPTVKHLEVLPAGAEVNAPPLATLHITSAPMHGGRLRCSTGANLSTSIAAKKRS